MASGTLKWVWLGSRWIWAELEVVTGEAVEEKSDLVSVSVSPGSDSSLIVLVLVSFSYRT